MMGKVVPEFIPLYTRISGVGTRCILGYKFMVGHVTAVCTFWATNSSSDLEGVVWLSNYSQ